MTHLDELLSVYLDGETTPAEATRVQTHLKDCLRCRRRLADLNDARAAVRSLPLLELPVPLAAGPQVPPVHRRRRVWLGAAAAAAAAVIAVSTLATPAPDPLDLSDVSRQLGARAALDAGAGPLKVVVPVAVDE